MPSLFSTSKEGKLRLIQGSQMWDDIGGQVSQAVLQEVLLSWLLGVADQPDRDLADMVQELLQQQGQQSD